MSLAAVDFLRRPQQPWVGWVLLIAGAAALGAAIWFERQWAAERSEALRLQQLSQTAKQIKPKAARPVEPTAAERRWQQAEKELQRPWLGALRAIESATTPPIYLLALSIEPATGLVKLEAEAPSFARALTYVEALDKGGALRLATIVSHTQATSLSGNLAVVRFSVATQWNAP